MNQRFITKSLGNICARDGNRTRTDISVHRILSPACIPISPPELLYVSLSLLTEKIKKGLTICQPLFVPRTRVEPAHHFWHYPLKVACLPFHHLGIKSLPKTRGALQIMKTWSGKRDSDPRPQPWQGCALPTELFPHLGLQI